MKLESAKDFIWVHVGGVKAAIECDVEEPPYLQIRDCDFEKLAGGSIDSVSDVEALLQQGSDKFCTREADWQEYDEAALAAAKESGKKFGLLAFTSDRDDSKSTLAAFNHPAVAKLLDKVLLMKTEYVVDSELARQWKVMGTPNLLVVDMSRPEGRQIVDRIGGKQSVRAVRNLIQKNLAAAAKSGTASKRVK